MTEASHPAAAGSSRLDPAFDLDAYLERIGYDGDRTPNAFTLRAIHRLHPAAIAFENLDPLLGRPPRLDLATLQKKLVAGTRGGYCFEHNTLLSAALHALGFTVVGLAARVVWGLDPDDAPRPRTHMLLRVDLDDGPWIADVGFGGLSMTGPLRLRLEVAQETPHDLYRFQAHGHGFELQAQIQAEWRPLYRFTTEPQLPIDYEAANWFTATHPSSAFTYGLMASRATAQGRVSLANNRLTRRPKLGEPVVRELASVDELIAVLRDDFAVAPPAAIRQLEGRLGF